MCQKSHYKNSKAEFQHAVYQFVFLLTKTLKLIPTNRYRQLLNAAVRCNDGIDCHAWDHNSFMKPRETKAFLLGNSFCLQLSRGGIIIPV